MIGLVLALLYSGWQYLTGTPVEVFYPVATNFLFWWYVVMAILVGLFYIGISFLVSLGLMAKGAEAGGVVGGFLGLTVGGGGHHLVARRQLSAEFRLPYHRGRPSPGRLRRRAMGRRSHCLRRSSRPRWHFAGPEPLQLFLLQKKLARNRICKRKTTRGDTQGGFLLSSRPLQGQALQVLFSRGDGHVVLVYTIVATHALDLGGLPSETFVSVVIYFNLFRPCRR